MDNKSITEKVKEFALKRLIEFIGISILVFSILIFTALISYSPSDPNFIYPKNQEINNILGINGSIGADFLLQSLGLISYFLPVTLICLSIKIIFQKTLRQIFNCLFYIVCYSIIGTIFLTQFYKDAFFLIINGNGGFVGDYFYNKIFFKIVNLHTQLSYYFQLLLFIVLFLISINFRFVWLSFVKKVFVNKKLASTNEAKKFERESIIENDYIQETFTFDKKNENRDNQKIVYNLPKLDLLEKPKEKNLKNNLRSDINEEFLEKILLDFGVEGKIKKLAPDLL